MKNFFAIFVVFCSLLVALPSLAVNPDEILSDPLLELRAREISKELRCLVCQNQSIDDSDAELARDLRVLVRERLVLGESDTEVLDYIVARYGEFVLLKPVLGLHTLVLWVATPALLLFGFVVMFLILRRGGTLIEEPLNAAERAALAQLLETNSDGDDTNSLSR